MNPTAANSTIRRPIVNDVTRPTSSARPQNQASLTGSAPQIVGRIPLHSPIHQQIGEDEELDRIMHDVGQELKASDKKHDKRRFLFFHRKQNSKQPVTAPTQPAPAPALQSVPPSPHQSSAPSSVVQAVRSQAALKPAKNVRSSTPVLVFSMTLVVTSALIAIAWSTYSQ